MQKRRGITTFIACNAQELPDIDGVCDSKALDEEQREIVFAQIQAKCKHVYQV